MPLSRQNPSCAGFKRLLSSGKLLSRSLTVFSHVLARMFKRAIGRYDVGSSGVLSWFWDGQDSVSSEFLRKATEIQACVQKKEELMSTERGKMASRSRVCRPWTRSSCIEMWFHGTAGTATKVTVRPLHPRQTADTEKTLFTRRHPSRKPESCIDIPLFQIGRH